MFRKKGRIIIDNSSQKMKIWNWKLYGQFLNLLHRLFYPKIFLFFKFWESLKYLIQKSFDIFCYIKFLSLKKQAELLMDIVPFDVILYFTYFVFIYFIRQPTRPLNINNLRSKTKFCFTIGFRFKKTDEKYIDKNIKEVKSTST